MLANVGKVLSKNASPSAKSYRHAPTSILYVHLSSTSSVTFYLTIVMRRGRWEGGGGKPGGMKDSIRK